MKSMSLIEPYLTYCCIVWASTTSLDLLYKLQNVLPVCVRAAKTAPWYDEDCRCAKKETCRLEKLYRRNKTKDDEQLWQAQFERQQQFFQRQLRGY